MMNTTAEYNENLNEFVLLRRTADPCPIRDDLRRRHPPHRRRHHYQTAAATTRGWQYEHNQQSDRRFQAVRSWNATAIQHAQGLQYAEALHVFRIAFAELGITVVYDCSSPSPAVATAPSDTLTASSAVLSAATAHLDHQGMGACSRRSMTSSPVLVELGPSSTQQRQHEGAGHQQKRKRCEIAHNFMIDQRLEYDEGWEGCSDFINFDDVFPPEDEFHNVDDNVHFLAEEEPGGVTGAATAASDCSLLTTEMTAVLLYNVGMTIFLRDRSKESPPVTAAWVDPAAFLQAHHLLDTLQQQNQNPRPEGQLPCSNAEYQQSSQQQRYCYLMARTLMAIGYVQYWNKRIQDAIHTFKRALLQTQVGSGCSVSEAKTATAMDSSWRPCSSRAWTTMDENNNQKRFSHQTAIILNSLGVLHFHLSKPETDVSLEYLLRALTIGKQVLGPQNKLVATTLNNIGRVHFTADRMGAALGAYNESLRIRRKILSADHVDVAATVYNTSQTLHQMGDLDTALEHYKEFVRITFKLNRPNRYLVVVLKCIAIIYHERRDHEQAMFYFEKALAVGRDVLGLYHADIASILNKLGNLNYEVGNFDESMKMYQDGLRCERAVFDPHHPNIVVTLSNIAQIYKLWGDNHAALRLYKEALDIQREAFDCSDPSLAVTLSNIGMIYYQSKKYLLAMEMYQESLRIRRDYHGDNSLEVASCLNSIGLVLFRVGLNDLALEAFGESLRTRRHLQGELHQDIAILLSNIATIHLEMGNEEMAIGYYRETLRVERASLGPDHDDVTSTLQYLAMVFQKRGETTLALRCYFDVLEILQKKTSSGSTLPDSASHTSSDIIKHDITVCVRIAQLLNTIANLELQLGNAKGAMEAITEAVRVARRAAAAASSARLTGTDGEGERVTLLDADTDIKLYGFDFYGLSKLHPEAAAAA